MANNTVKPPDVSRSSDASTAEPFPEPREDTLPQTGFYTTLVKFWGVNPYSGNPNALVAATVGEVVKTDTSTPYDFSMEFTPGPKSVLMTYQWFANDGQSGAKLEYLFTIYILTPPT